MNMNDDNCETFAASETSSSISDITFDDECVSDDESDVSNDSINSQHIDDCLVTCRRWETSMSIHLLPHQQKALK